MQQKTLVDAKIFASRLKSLQAHANIKSSALAKEVGVSEPTVSQWRAGRHMPDREIWGKLADLFGREVEDLFFRRTEESLPQINEAQAKYMARDPRFKNLPGRHMIGMPDDFGFGDEEPPPPQAQVTRAELEAEVDYYLSRAEKAGALAVAALAIRKHLKAEDFDYFNPTKGKS